MSNTGSTAPSRPLPRPPDATIPRLLVAPGEPAGIGPDILIEQAQRAWPAELVAVGDGGLLRDRARRLNLPLELLPCHPAARPQPQVQGTLRHWPVDLLAPVEAGRPDPANARYVLNCLRTAVIACQHGVADALVTGPVQKSTINDAGIAFTGHTEFLGELTHATPLMLLVAGKLRVALATTHLPLADVPKALTRDGLRQRLQILHAGLRSRFGIAQPRILVAGLNPHAGESGYLGREEIDVIEPVLHELRQGGMALSGPLPADTLFTPRWLEQADAVLAMYHDQGLPVLKFAGFGHAVNVTLGLPIVRTSVDHGTALELAGTGDADAGSLGAAIELALELLATTRR